MMDVKYQVFVSSTFEDLEIERRLVTEQILNLGHIPVGMELFQAGDENQWEYIKRRVLDCDYYVLIVAERYGSQRGAKSYTQLEYEHAVQNGVPVAAFLLSAEARASWPQDKLEVSKRTQIAKFRKLCEKRLVKYWSNGDDLKAKVATTLVELTREKPRTGWVRSDSVAASAALNEIAKLSEERRSLQERVDALESKEGPSKPSGDVLHRLETLNDTMVGQFIRMPQADQDMSVLEVFMAINRKLSIGLQDLAFSYEVQDAIGIEKAKANHASVSGIIAEMAAHNLIDFSIHTLANGRPGKNYRLTDYGKQFVMYADQWLSEQVD